MKYSNEIGEVSFWWTIFNELTGLIFPKQNVVFLSPMRLEQQLYPACADIPRRSSTPCPEIFNVNIKY